MPLSEQDLLLLDCFMYSDLAPKSEIGSSLADMVNSFVDPNGYKWASGNAAKVKDITLKQVLYGFFSGQGLKY